MRVKIVVSGVPTWCTIKYMNVLGSLPSSSSGRYSLDGLDVTKLIRMFLVLLVSGFVQQASTLAGATYVWHGVDFTPYVVVLIPLLLEAARRFLSGDSASPAPSTSASAAAPKT